jgi:hypothetical protein
LCDYEVMKDRYFEMYESVREACRIPVFPNVTVGWDPSARTDPAQPWDPTRGYPYQHVLRNSSPEAFGAAMRRAIEAVAPVPGDKIVTINAWNEWTEGSYLEPDRQHGNAYLKAIRSSQQPWSGATRHERVASKV